MDFVLLSLRIILLILLVILIFLLVVNRSKFPFDMIENKAKIIMLSTLSFSVFCAASYSISQKSFGKILFIINFSFLHYLTSFSILFRYVFY